MEIQPLQGMVEPPTALILLLHGIRLLVGMFKCSMCSGLARQMPAPLSGNMSSVLVTRMWTLPSTGVKEAGISSTLTVSVVSVSLVAS